MRLCIFLSRCIGPALVALPTLLLKYAIPATGEPVAVAIAFGWWCFAIGYIDRGWTEHLRSIGEI